MSRIEIKNITKHFGEVAALNNVGLSLEENKIYGLLGRNGAGKSTLLNIISNRIFTDSGEVLFDGASMQENDDAQRKLYLMSEKNYYPEAMRVKEAFKWSEIFYPEFDSDQALKLANQFSLPVSRKLKGLSTGYTSIFKLIIALCVNTPFVFFDEPVLGLDANHRELFYQILLEKYADQPFTAVISTHLIEEVSGIIEDVIVIKNGRIIRDEPREKLMGNGYTASGLGAVVDAFIKGRDCIDVEVLGGLKSAYIVGPIPETVPDGISIGGMDLQKLFIKLTNSEEESNNEF